MTDRSMQRRGRPILATPAEVTKHQKRLKYSDEDLALELGVTIPEVIAYQTGATEMPDNIKEAFVLVKRKTTRKNKPRGAARQEAVPVLG